MLEKKKKKKQNCKKKKKKQKQKHDIDLKTFHKASCIVAIMAVKERHVCALDTCI